MDRIIQCGSTWRTHADLTLFGLGLTDTLSEEGVMSRRLNSLARPDGSESDSSFFEPEPLSVAHFLFNGFGPTKTNISD